MLKCELEVYDNKTHECQLITGEIIGEQTADDYDGLRYDVRGDNGQIYLGCHKDCVHNEYI